MKYQPGEEAQVAIESLVGIVETAIEDRIKPLEQKVEELEARIAALEAQLRQMR